MEIQVFNHELFGAIRVISRNGEPWFVGKDVAQVLGYVNTKDALGKHVDVEDKLGSQIATSGQRRNTTIINESGLYSLILSSKLPKAREFKHWVTAEVLPQIRKTGGYIPVKEGDDEKVILCKAVKILIDLAEESGIDLKKKIWAQAVDILCEREGLDIDTACKLFGKSKLAWERAKVGKSL